MPDRTKDILERIATGADLGAENDLTTRIKDEIDNAATGIALRTNILNLLHPHANTPAQLADMSFGDSFKYIQRAMDNLTVGKTDAEVATLNGQRKKLRQKVNLIVRKAIREKYAELEAQIPTLTATVQAAATMALKRKYISSRIQEEIENNRGSVMNRDRLARLLFEIYNEGILFRGATAEDQFKDTTDLMTITGPITLAEINTALTTVLGAGGGVMRLLLEQSKARMDLWGTIDTNQLSNIERAKTRLNTLKTSLESELIIYNTDDLLQELIVLNPLDPVLPPFNTATLSPIILALRTELNSAGNSGTQTDRCTQALARILNVRIGFTPAFDYDHASTFPAVALKLREWQNSQAALQGNLRDRINEAIDSSNVDFNANPEDFDRVINKLISDLSEMKEFGDTPAKALNTISRRLIVAPLHANGATTNPNRIEEVRARLIEHLNHPAGGASILTNHNDKINRLNTVVRADTYAEIETVAATLVTPVTNIIALNGANQVFDNLVNIRGFNIDELGEALYLNIGSRNRTDIERDISNKLLALRSSMRFIEHPTKRLSDSEIENALTPNMPNCEKIIEEMMRVHPLPIIGPLAVGTNHLQYRMSLETVLNNPNSNIQAYLKFKEIAGKYGNISDILMLQDIAFHKALGQHGYTFNLSPVLNAGFRPNKAVESVIRGNRPPFEECLSGYNNTFEYLRERYNFLVSLSDEQRTEAQKSEFDTLNQITNNNQTFHDLIKDISENFSKISSRPDTDLAKKLYLILEKKYNPRRGTASSMFAHVYLGASSMEENLAHCYKTILALKTVFVPRVEENSQVMDASGKISTPLEAERESLDKSRTEYAKNRRKLQKFGWFRRPKEENLDDSRDEYMESSKKYMLNQIENEFPQSDFEGSDPERAKQRKLDRRNRLLGLLNAERKELFDEELRAMNNRPNVFSRTLSSARNAWRKHKLLRLGVGATLLTGGLISSAMGGGALLGSFTIMGGLYRGIGSYMGFTAGFEAIRNRFGATKKLKRKKIKEMNPDEIQSAMAAQTTLALSEKGSPYTVPGSNPPLTTTTVPIGDLKRPVANGDFDSQDARAVNAMYSPKHQERLVYTDENPQNYRQKTSRELWTEYNNRMRQVIDQAFDEGKSTEEVLNIMFVEEEKLMKATEKQEEKIRKSNLKKHLYGAALGAFMGVGIPFGAYLGEKIGEGGVYAGEKIGSAWDWSGDTLNAGWDEVKSITN